MFSDALRILRNKKGLTQAQLAEILEISAGAVGMYEQGSRVPRPEMLCKLGAYFGVSIDVLLDFESEKHINKVVDYTLTDDELELLQEYRKLDKKGKTIVLATCYQEQEKQNTKDFMLEVAKEIS